MRTVCLFTASVLATAVVAADTCKALVMSGGGSNGSWEAGVMWGMLNYGNPSDFEWDVVTGVSAGSINTIYTAGYKVGDEANMAQNLSDLWKNLHSSDVWKDWTLGKVWGATAKQGAVDNSPLLAYLTNLLSAFTEGYGRRVSLGSVNANTGVYTEFTQKNTEFMDLAQASVSSASIPFVFPPHVWEGKGVFMDGGTVYNVDLEGAIAQCMDLVDDESKIIIDIYFCGAPKSAETEEKVGNSWENYFRGRSLRKYYGDSNSIALAMVGHPTVQMRHMVNQAVGAMSGTSELNFEGDFTWAAQLQGRTDAQTSLAGNGSYDVKAAFNEWIADEMVREDYPQVGDFLLAKQSPQPL